MLLVQNDIRKGVHDRAQELIRGDEILKVKARYDVLDPGIVRVEGDEIVDSQIHQLLEHIGCIQGFAPGAVVLAALIQEGHDHGQARCLAVDRGDDAL